MSRERDWVLELIRERPLTCLFIVALVAGLLHSRFG